MTVATSTFRTAYAAAFHSFLARGTNEEDLHAAYELGRDAVARDLGLLDLALVHHEVLAAEIESEDAGDARSIARAAADFQVEALSAYEMVRRGFGEALEAVAVERRQAAVLRRLSTLLADASLAAYTRSSVEEVLQLVVEQAAELTDAACCVACASVPGVDRAATAACSEGAGFDVTMVAQDALAAVSHRQDPSGAVSVETSAVPGGVLAAPLLALDGRPIGVVALVAHPVRRFGELDSALLVHIAQMTAAAVERSARYAR